MAVETTPGDPTNVMLATFRDELAATKADAFKLEFFDGGSLGDEGALMEMLRVNQVQVIPIGSDIVELDQMFAVFDAPFLFDSKEKARKALAGELGEMLKQSLRDTAGLEALAFGELGFRVISNNVRPIDKPADLAGLKLRTPGSAMRIAAFTTLGASPTPMSLGDVYVALRQGALDGQENPMSVIEEFSFHEVQKYISLTNHVYTPITLAMNGRAFDALSDDLKAAVIAAAEAAAEATHKLSDEQDARLVEFFEKAGVAVNKPDLAAFREAAVPVHEQVAQTVTPEFMDKVKSIINE
ncbi:C4-dicarboxylate ABC transporter substrate-binding protein [Nitratireductor aestuarii]|uniref:C4-dicarboxylate ABC transporter substrate-binding protein n=1 Tax=Nitratireductor aestuarii TaxID=1735103 RepID=A0A916W621_9HYPH|nr:TRAP transporter substrate-binding protein [Nitratireductor aestuarii]GGA69071.1 C4-dicarboxylate ABC transporter substrate-binding protein [Nitratireductor aestuarii]